MPNPPETLTPAPAPARGVASENHEKRNSRVIKLLLAAAFVVILNETIMSVALTELMEDLTITAGAAQWLTTAFMLTMAVVIPVTGFLLQRFSTRAMFIAAMTAFSIGTLICAVAPGFAVLLVGRIIQASGTAVMMPLLMTTLMKPVPASKRGRTMGNVSIVISVAPAIGPTVSGLILNALSWRWMFWIVLPIALAMLAVGIRKVENVTETEDAPLDVASVILSALGFGGLVYGLSSIGGEGGESASGVVMWTAFIVGVAGLGLFVLRQFQLQRRDTPLLDLRTFRSPIFSVSVALMVVSMAALFGSVILLPIYLQQVLGLEPLQVGLFLLPGGLVMGLLAPFVGRLYDRFGPRVLLVPGTLVLSAVLWFLSTVNEDTPTMTVLTAHVTLSVGLAFLFTPLFTTALGSVKPALYSHASAVISTVQQVAGAAGTAVFITVMTSQSAALTASGAAEPAAVAGGVGDAFMVGAVVSLLAIVAACFVRRPDDAPEGTVVPVH